MNATVSNIRCISFKDTTKKVGFSRSTLYLTLADESSDFPRPLTIGRRRYFLEQEIDEWILGRPRGMSKSKRGERP